MNGKKIKTSSSYLYKHEPDAWEEPENNSQNISEEQLKELISKRKERYTDQKYFIPEDTKPPNKYVVLSIMGVILAYFITAFVLNVTGSIDKLTMILMVLPVLAIILLIYFIYTRRKKNK